MALPTVAAGLIREIKSKNTSLNMAVYGSKYSKVIDSQKSSIHSAVVRVKLRRKLTDLAEASSSVDHKKVLPRYVRVNTLVNTVAEVIDALVADGYKQTDRMSLEDPTKWLVRDSDIDNLLVLPSNTDLHESSLLTSGGVILQDKASCMPAFVLAPPTGSHVIDACAAPGNKTTHLAAIMNNKGSITAFEINKKRCDTLRTMLKNARVTCCCALNVDFTKCDISQYSQVEYILVDPSCSGSGICSRLNHLTDDSQSASEDRLQKLSSFQSVILKKALSFPSVKRVVYSTCSVHEIENEMVVRDVLQQCKESFCLESILPRWKNRGSDLNGSFPAGTNCIRASPDTDFTNGFFVASFVRKNK